VDLDDCQCEAHCGYCGSEVCTPTADSWLLKDGTEANEVMEYGDEFHSVIGKGKAGIAVHGTPSHSYGVSLAIWDHTVLPSTRHK